MKATSGLRGLALLPVAFVLPVSAHTADVTIGSFSLRRRWNVVWVLSFAMFIVFDVYAAAIPKLFKAAGAGDIATVNRLLEAGAGANERVSSGATALIVAAQNGHDRVVRALLAKGADINAATSGEASTSGRTALHFAAQEGRADVVVTLLFHGAAIDAKTGNGYTPLILAAESGETAIIRTLVEKGASIDLPNHAGVSPLIAAVMKGHEEAALVLTELGSAVDARANNGISALMIASYLGNERLVRGILQGGAAVNLSDGEGNTALDYATMKKRSSIRYRLLNLGATAKRTGHQYGEELMAGKVETLTENSITVVAPEGKRMFLIGPETRLCADGRETHDRTKIRPARTVTVFTYMNEKTARRIDNKGFTMRFNGSQWVRVMPKCRAP